MTGTDARPVALVLRALHLGDVLTGLPALRLLRRAIPDHRIVLAVPSTYAEIPCAAGVVDATTPAWELEPLLAAPSRPDLAIDLHGNGPQSVRLLQATEPSRLIAYWGGDHRWRAEEHEVARWCRLVAEGFDLAGPWPGMRGQLPAPAAPTGLAGSVVVHPGASAGARRWPLERYAEVVTGLRRTGHRVLVSAGPGESERAVAVARDQAEVVDQLSLQALLGLIAAAPLLVSGDTGVAHAAAVFGTPSVTLFGPVSPARWGPPPDPRHIAIWHGGSGDPHGSEPAPALLDITVREVIDACAAAVKAR